MDYERAYATIIMVIGATVFGYIVGSVSALASNPNGSQARETVKILAVSNYLGEKKVQQKLRQVGCLSFVENLIGCAVLLLLWLPLFALARLELALRFLDYAVVPQQ